MGKLKVCLAGATGWAVIVVSGICTFISLYMSFLGFRLGDSGAFLFSGFGLLFGGLFVVFVIKLVAKKSPFLKSKPVYFVPHRFIMTALIIAGICILAAVLFPVFF